MMVFISNGELHVSAYSGHHQVLTIFLPRRLGILYKTLTARKLSKPDDGRYRPKHVVFHSNNTII